MPPHQTRAGLHRVFHRYIHTHTDTHTHTHTRTHTRTHTHKKNTRTMCISLGCPFKIVCFGNICGSSLNKSVDPSDSQALTSHLLSNREAIFNDQVQSNSFTKRSDH